MTTQATETAPPQAPDTVLFEHLTDAQQDRWRRLSRSKHAAQEPRHLDDARDLLSRQAWATDDTGVFVCWPGTAYEQVVRGTTDVRPGACDCADYTGNDVLCAHRMAAWVIGVAQPPAAAADPPQQTAPPAGQPAAPGTTPEPAPPVTDGEPTPGAQPAASGGGRATVQDFYKTTADLSAKAPIAEIKDENGDKRPYFAWQTAQGILNVAAAGRWSTRVPSYGTDARQAIVTVRVIVHLDGIDLSQEAISAAPLERFTRQNKPIPKSAENAFKNAQRNAFKRACEGFGIGVPQAVKERYRRENASRRRD